MGVRGGVIIALGIICALCALVIHWQGNTIKTQIASLESLRRDMVVAVDANRQANATITRLERSANATISVTVDWSARNDTLSAVGLDTAVAISEAKHDNPATDALDAPLPDSVSASLGRLYVQACAAASGGRAVPGGVEPAGASADTPTNPPAPKKPVDLPQTGNVGGRPVNGPGQERGR